SDKEDWVKYMDEARPDGKPPEFSDAHEGYIGSSDKVINDLSHSCFKAVRRAMPELHAVEMEAVGAGAAMLIHQSEYPIGLSMVRGISDEPKTAAERRKAGASRRSGTKARVQWKRYAAAA